MAGKSCIAGYRRLAAVQAVEEKRKADDISAVLYPNDATEYGKELRLKQQYFFVSASHAGARGAAPPPRRACSVSLQRVRSCSEPV